MPARLADSPTRELPVSQRGGSRFVLLLLLLLPLISVPAAAQEKKSDGKKTDSDAKSSGDDVTSIFDRLADGRNAIFYLYSDFIRNRKPDWVAIPSEEYDELKRIRAERQAMFYSITSIELSGALDQLNKIKAVFNIVVREGVGRQPIDLNLREAQLTDAAIRESDPNRGEERAWIERSPDGPHRVLIDKPGRYTLELTLSASPAKRMAEERFLLSLPYATRKSIRFTSPENILFARFESPGRARDVTPNADPKLLAQSLSSEESLDLVWRTVRTVSALTPVLSAKGAIRVHVYEQFVDTDADLEIEALSDIRELVLKLDPNDKLRTESVRLVELPAKVADAGIPSQLGSIFNLPFDRTIATGPPDVKKVEDGLLVTIPLTRPTRGTMRLRFSAERARGGEGEPIRVGKVDLQNADPQTGQLLLFSEPSLRVDEKPRFRLHPIPLNQLPAEFSRNQPLAAFQYLRQPAALDLDIRKESPVASLAADNKISVWANRIEMETKVKLAIRQGQIKEVGLVLPGVLRPVVTLPRADFRQGGAAGGNVNLSEKDEGDLRTLRFREPIAERVDLTITGAMPLSPEARQATLRLPTAVGMTESTGTVAIQTAENVRITFPKEGVKSLTRELTPPGQNGTQWTFRYSGESPTLTIIVEQIPQEIAAEVDSKISIEEQAIGVDCSIAWKARYEPLTRVQLNVPAGVEELTLDGDLFGGRRNLTPGEQILELTRPTSECKARLRYRSKRTAESPGAVPVPLVVPPPQVATTYKASIWNAPSLRASAATPGWTTSSPATSIDVAAKQRCSAVVESNQAQSPLSIRLEETAGLASFVAPAVHIREILARDGRRNGLKRWLIAQSRLKTAFLHVPDGVRVTEVGINDVPAKTLELGGRVLEIPLPVEEGPTVLEVWYLATADVSPTMGRSFLRTPELADATIAGDVVWEICTGTNRLLMRPTMSAADIIWRFLGPVAIPTNRIEMNSASNLVGGRSLSASWNQFAERQQLGGKWWTFGGQGNDGNLEILVVDHSFWILIVSGSLLAVGLAVLRWSNLDRAAVLVTLVITWMALATISPTWSGWLWYGGQWGVFTIVGVALVRWFLPRRKLLQYRFRRLLSARRAPLPAAGYSAPGSARRELPVPSFSSLGSTVDAE